MSGFFLNVNAKAKAAPYTEAAFALNPLSGLFPCRFRKWLQIFFNLVIYFAPPIAIGS